MDRDVYLITRADETFVGKVGNFLSNERNKQLEQAMRDVVDSIVFGADSGDYAVLTVELR